MGWRREVTAPDGRVWQVRRRWVSRRIRLRKERDRGGESFSVRDVPRVRLDVPDPLVDESLTAIAVLIVAIVLSILVFNVVVPIVALTLELMLLALLVAAGAVGRVVLRRPWRIEAATHRGRPETLTWHAFGLRNSRAAVDRIAYALEQGFDPASVERATLIETPPQRQLREMARRLLPARNRARSTRASRS